MKFRKITFENHPILGNLSLDFTDRNGNTIDTIIIAGENGCGKSVLLEELYQLDPSNTNDIRGGKVIAEIEISQKEKDAIQKRLNSSKEPFYGNILTIEQDWTLDWDNENRMKVIAPYREHITYGGGWWFGNMFKSVFSDAEINFTPGAISSVTSSNIDEIIKESIKSSYATATEITQLLVDIDALDNADLAKWVKDNPGRVPPENVSGIRMKRFINAFHSIFPNKRYVEIDNAPGSKTVEFEEYGKRMSIDKLSSGEKQIVFRGGFLLRNQKTTEGAVILIDEPEISLHPKWQLEIMNFLKSLFKKDGKQTSQLIVATHSPFIIHNVTRANDKVIVMKKNTEGIIISENPEYYSWTKPQVVKEAFNIGIDTLIENNRINVFLEGETDEMYYKKAMDVFGIDKEKISFKWIGRETEKGTENSGASALDSAVKHYKANPHMIPTPIVFLYDCDTNRQAEDDKDIHIRTMTENKENTICKKGVENLLKLPSGFNMMDFCREKEKIDEYSLPSVIRELDKMKLCHHICSLSDEELKIVLKNLHEEIQKLLSIS